jgi:hypothetical protein
MAKERLMLRLSARKHELEREGYSQAEITDILRDADKEAEEEAEAMFNAAGRTVEDNGKFQVNRGGANETRGEKIDNNLMAKDQRDE